MSKYFTSKVNLEFVCMIERTLATTIFICCMATIVRYHQMSLPVFYLYR